MSNLFFFPIFLCTWSRSNFWSSLCSCLDFFLSHKMFRKGFDMPHCSSFCWSTSGGLSTFLKTRMLIICETYKTGINAHEKHSSLSRLYCDVILFFFFAVRKTLLIGYSCQTNIWMCQVLGTVYIWADTICECEYKLCTYMNANLCFISMQTCDDFTALHLQRELFSHTHEVWKMLE